MLDDFYFADPRVVLVPIEHLTPEGVTASFASTLRARCGFAPAGIALLDEGIRLYWTRVRALARRASFLRPPRLKNVGVVRDAAAVRPYAPMLNQSTWTVYETDLDPELSHPELVAYLLAHGDRMAEVGEVTLAAVHLAPWWFERGDEERAAFARAAEACSRPDAGLYRAIAGALPWLRQLRHETLRPPRSPRGHRPVPGTGLLVPRAVEAEPERLVARSREIATAALSAFYDRWREREPAAVRELATWLREDAPALLVTGRGGGIVWDPDDPHATGRIEHELAGAGGAAVRSIAADLAVVAARTRAFLGALVDPSSLPPADPEIAQSGYSYMHAARRLVAYNLHEPGIERLSGPPLPYAREMLAARTIHEWTHLAVDAGYVPVSMPAAGFAELLEGFAGLLDEAIARAPRAVRERTEPDLRRLRSTAPSAGGALAAIFASRLPDYQANLLGRRFLRTTEIETYVRQNVRPLHREYAPPELWRMLVRYLYELQYLGLGAVGDPRGYFLACTGFGDDFFASRAIDASAFAALAEAARRICAAHAVDESRLHPVPAP